MEIFPVTHIFEKKKVLKHWLTVVKYVEIAKIYIHNNLTKLQNSSRYACNSTFLTGAR